jgi:hypothetical protein
MSGPQEGLTVLSAILSLTTFVTLTMTMSAQQPPAGPPNCRVTGKSVPLRELPEASGVAASRRTPGLFWAHNDSGDPVIFGIDAAGAIKSRVRVTGAGVDDWEDIAVGPCPQGSCVYIADIGDNNRSRKQITLYRVAEPAPGDAATSRAEAFHAVYPDGPHDAEALFVSRESDVFLITKGDPGSVALFKFPRPLASGTTLPLQQIGQPAGGAKTEAKDRPTAADMSPDGRWVVVRTTDWLAFYRTADLIAGRWREAFRTDLSGLGERRGEGITFAGNDTLILVGEAGGRLRGDGTFAQLTCTLGQ